jgi:hypothetical protein
MTSNVNLSLMMEGHIRARMPLFASLTVSMTSFPALGQDNCRSQREWNHNAYPHRVIDAIGSTGEWRKVNPVNLESRILTILT